METKKDEKRQPELNHPAQEQTVAEFISGLAKLGAERQGIAYAINASTSNPKTTAIRHSH
jgi:hypothetical protein